MNPTCLIKKINNFKSLNIFILLFLVSACSSNPYVEDWDRERYASLEDLDFSLNVCFDRSSHSRQLVEQTARAECAKRITERERIVQVLELQEAQNLSQAEGTAFQGPVIRQKNIEAQILTLELAYTGNDKWDCPLLSPNRVKYICRYNEKATDSRNRAQQNLPSIDSPNLPPELPEDLKP